MGSLLFLLVAATLLVVLPRRLAVIPLLLAAAYTARTPIVEIGPINLSVLRVLVVIGFVRVVIRGERFAHGISATDFMAITWAACLVATSIFHSSDAWTFRIGLVSGELGVYALCRMLISSQDDIHRLFKLLTVLLLPLAALMILESVTGHNYFAIFGGPGVANLRDGFVRAYGPFGHPILAGTVGATYFSIALYLWWTNRVLSIVGMCAALGMVLASGSSGPIMMLAFAGFGLGLWKAREHLRVIRWATVGAILCLALVMKDPVYFLMARIDIVGGSTGWHRAQLIRASLEHLDEWWAYGTDRTRHWMPTGIPANDVHTDVTNHFLQIGVWGGLPLLAIFITMLVFSFRSLGRAMTASAGLQEGERFQAWVLGVMLFAQLVNFWACSPFDQSASFFYLILAAIGAVSIRTEKSATLEVAAKGRIYPMRPAHSARGPAPPALPSGNRTGARFDRNAGRVRRFDARHTR